MSKVYAIKNLTFEKDEPTECDEIIAVLDSHNAKPHGPAKWYVTVLVKVSD